MLTVEKLCAFYTESTMCGTKRIYAGENFADVMAIANMFKKAIYFEDSKSMNEKFEEIEKESEAKGLITYNSDDMYNDYIFYKDGNQFFAFDEENLCLYKLQIIERIYERY